jgi:hypothetical protein
MMATKMYQTRQWIKVLWVTLPLITLLVIAMDSNLKTMDQYLRSVSLLLAINALVIVLIGSLKIRLDEQRLSWNFGFLPWPIWRLDLTQIERVELCETRAVEGWGLRFTREGMLYNAAGKAAVRIYKRDGKCLRLGSAEADVLLGQISERLK